MPSNHLEDLIAEWYQFKGYFVRKNIPVNPRPQGGFETELDIVAFNPETKHLVHIEPSLDADSWDNRQRRYEKKFKAGKDHIPKMFASLVTQSHPIDQIAVFVFCSKNTHSNIGGGKILHDSVLMADIFKEIKDRKLDKKAIPEQFPLLRTLQYVAEYWRDILAVYETR
jgi:hypothetical protein